MEPRSPVLTPHPSPAEIVTDVLNGTRAYDRLVTERLEALEFTVHRLHELLKRHIRTIPKFDLSEVDWKRLCVVLNKVALRI